ncbi:MAG: efflux RND transporter periplasmic adaptor subunit [Pseudomonadota bacterium]
MAIKAHKSYDAASEAGAPARWHVMLAGVLKALVPLAILAVAIPYASYLYHSGPVAERADRPRVPRLVEVVEVTPSLRGPTIQAWGEVVPSRVLTLRPEVSGVITQLHPRLAMGGEIEAGARLALMDDRALRSELLEAEAEIAEIEARIAIERGQQARAQRDLDRGGLSLTEEQRSLVLREPQMAQLIAELQAAEAARDRAALDVSKAELLAPFDALVLEDSVALGASMTPDRILAELAAADVFHVVLAVPAAALAWIDPDGGGIVELSQPGVWPDGVTREGTILRRGAQLSATGRMVELIVAVEDPLSLHERHAGEPKLLLGSFLRADIQGRAVPNAVEIDRAYLRDGGQVWVMQPDNTLDIRPVEIAWLGADRVLIAGGLAEGERIVTTNLAVTAPGMTLRLPEPEPDPETASATGDKT